jgi:hypothetical protein
MSDIALLEEMGQVQTRGVPGTSVRKGILKRFFPASALSLGGLASALFVADGAVSLGQLLLVGLEVFSLTLGFGIGLAALKAFLFPDAKVEGRRSLVAGLCSPLYLLLVSMFTQGSDWFQIAGWSTLTGFAVALVLFFPWLSRSPANDELELPAPGETDLESFPGPTE